MRVYTVNELCATHDCLTPGCPLTAVPGTDRCSIHEGRTDVGGPTPRVNTQQRLIFEAKKTRRWTKPKIVEAMQAWDRVHGKPPAQDEWVYVDEYVDRPTVYQVKVRFGSWSDAVVAAGFERRAFGRAACSASPGQIALRKFDHDEARARHAAGESQSALAREYGVSQTAVNRVVNEHVRARMQAASVKFIRDARMPCRGGCGVLVWQHSRPGVSGYCRACLGEKRNVVRHGTESEYSQGCRCGLCLTAASEAKRRRRERSRVPCSHGCGTLVDSINRRNPDKPLECLPCSIKRVKGLPTP